MGTFVEGILAIIIAINIIGIIFFIVRLLKWSISSYSRNNETAIKAVFYDETGFVSPITFIIIYLDGLTALGFISYFVYKLIFV
jgi:hypothetical protein